MMEKLISEMETEIINCNPQKIDLIIKRISNYAIENFKNDLLKSCMDMICYMVEFNEILDKYVNEKK